MQTPLPPGQYELDELPRFGLNQFANRFPDRPCQIEIEVGGDLQDPFSIQEELVQLEHTTQLSDFHCVTTWSICGLSWAGYRFSDFYHSLVATRGIPEPGIDTVIFRCQDGFRASLPLADLMQADVLLADTLDGKPLPIAHGAPLRLVAPAHYGYKNPKHINRIEFWRGSGNYRPPALAFMDHPRGLVALEQRGRGIPGILLRWAYRPLVKSTIRKFASALDKQNLKDTP